MARPEIGDLAHNWSQSGATTTSLIAQGQHTGLAAQVKAGAGIDLASVTIGSNDFVHVLNTSRSAAAMGPVMERASSNLAAILDALLGSSSPSGSRSVPRLIFGARRSFAGPSTRA